MDRECQVQEETVRWAHGTITATTLWQVMASDDLMADLTLKKHRGQLPSVQIGSNSNG
jgi:hypothetical protein